ncbi:hypothetical protein DFH28DRAFT_956579 [Melampsora americana]|nr:hypothetical protein DFH28DRAFT_956579 [Melampsora americana]
MTINSHPASSSKSLIASSSSKEDLLKTSIGSNKTKSLLRQATRLLKKDGLSEELRKSTEEQIKSLKSTLDQKSSQDQERSNAIRYHHVKFFDRKKIQRRLDQVIRKLDKMSDTYENDKKLARMHKRLTHEAQQLRIDLNYVNAYPKHLKYVSLYPNGHYSAHEESSVELPSMIPSTKKPDALRNYVRAYMADAMKKGILSSNPELKKQAVLEEEEMLEGDDDDEVRNAKQTEELAADDFFST